MKIFAVTDIHGRRFAAPELTELIKQVDLVLIAGDITQFGTDRDAEPIIDAFFKLNSNIFAVSGNCDQSSVADFLMQREISVQGSVRNLKEVTVFGCGGSNPSPFRTPQEYSENELDRILSRIETATDARYKIFLTHAPPHKTKVDRTFIGHHVGSKVVRNFIEKIKPDIVVCGHIHEAKGVDHIGETIIINPGPFPEHYANIKINTNIEYELK